MVDIKKVNFNDLQKVLCDGAICAYYKDLFYIGLTSGSTIHTFACTPQMFKSISVFMEKNVKNYEKGYGEIDMKIAPVISPLQMDDLGNKK